MFEWIKNYVMGRLSTLREKVDSYKGMIMTKQLMRLDREIEKSASWRTTFFGKQPKVCKNKPSKPPGLSSPKQTWIEPLSIETCSEHIHSFLSHLSYVCSFLSQVKSRFKKNTYVIGAKRQSERMRTLKIKDVFGHGKKLDDPLVIIEEKTTEELTGGGRISKSWTNICNGLTH